MGHLIGMGHVLHSKRELPVRILQRHDPCVRGQEPGQHHADKRARDLRRLTRILEDLIAQMHGKAQPWHKADNRPKRQQAETRRRDQDHTE